MKTLETVLYIFAWFLTALFLITMITMEEVNEEYISNDCNGTCTYRLP